MIYFKMEKIGNSTYNKEKKTRSKNLVSLVNLSYTGGRGRTGTSVRTLDFESSASANSATPAQVFNWGSRIAYLRLSG